MAPAGFTTQEAFEEPEAPNVVHLERDDMVIPKGVSLRDESGWYILTLRDDGTLQLCIGAEASRGLQTNRAGEVLVRDGSGVLLNGDD